jgi:(2Fe-2S) ferredoxin
MRYRRHVFVCTNTRPLGGKPSCGGRGGDALVASLQRLVASDPAMVGTVAITPCGCLGPCFDGPIAVAYPDGSWLAGVSADDAEALRDWLAGGAAPARLVHDWPDED